MMSINQHNSVPTTRTIYENVFEEKSECDLLIPDYYPPAEKIIQCCATPIIKEKSIENDQLVLEGECKFCIIYQSEAGELKTVSESAAFSEAVSLKNEGEECYIQTAIRLTSSSCRLLNERKISAKSMFSIAVKVKEKGEVSLIEEVVTEVEALYDSKNVYSVVSQVADATKIQGEIEVHKVVQDVLKTEGVISVKDVKIMGGKAMVKGVLSVFVLFSAEDGSVEKTSTAIPFSQLIDIDYHGEKAGFEATSLIQNIRTNVESDAEGKDRIISLVVSVLTEGEVYENNTRRLLMDAYSNRHLLNCSKERISLCEMTERTEFNEIVWHEVDLNNADIEIVHISGTPVVKKVVRREKCIIIEGILEMSAFIKEGDSYKSIEKNLKFEVNRELKTVSNTMRCEVKPNVLNMESIVYNDGYKIKTDLSVILTVFSEEEYEVITELELNTSTEMHADREHSLILYFGEQGERLWDIARKYATTVQKIKVINGLEQEILNEKRMILVS